MKATEIKNLAAHVGHNVHIADYMSGEPFDPKDKGRFCLECLDCGGEIILGERVLIGESTATSVTVT